MSAKTPLAVRLLQRAHSPAPSVTARRCLSGWKASSTRVEEYAKAPITPVTLSHLLELGKTRNALESAQLLHKELPKRLARRVRAIQKLPFIVGVNPWIKKVYELYFDSFETLSNIPAPLDAASEKDFADTLSDLVASHHDVIPDLAKGFRESGKHMSKEEKTRFLDDMIHARIAIRVLAEHHLALKDQISGWIGIVNTRLFPATLIRSTAEYVQELCEINYGSAPDFEIDGDVDTMMAYISVHLDYIFMELLKNANRATVEHSFRVGRRAHPRIQITIAQGSEDVTVRIRDQGGGISPEDLPRVFEYSFTTVPKMELEEEDSNIFSTQARLNMQAGIGGPIAGLGFGLPMSRIYARYFGGSLDLRSVSGHGLDVFLRVPTITQSLPTNMTI
ncbi:branched-chain alpha-ketoacid dehydrogenase [Zopfochytrium polystomum]|nr:branched-chain alpha-ketoacid dehydrogenase [Zopfochytrium polystomum]